MRKSKSHSDSGRKMDKQHQVVCEKQNHRHGFQLGTLKQGTFINNECLKKFMEVYKKETDQAMDLENLELRNYN